MNDNSILYSGQMKLADIVSEKYELISIIERLNVKLGFGDMSVAEVCNRYGLSTDLFLMICNIYSYEWYTPSIDTLKSSDIPNIVSYLRASHRYYIDRFFPRLHSNIHKMVENGDRRNRDVINKFYDNYDEEVSNHFSYEEDVVFPYIENLLANKDHLVSGYNIEQFEKNHTDIDSKLQDLKNIVIKYIPEDISNPYRYEVVYNIFQIDIDLKKHSLVENRILIPLVSKLEHNNE